MHRYRYILYENMNEPHAPHPSALGNAWLRYRAHAFEWLRDEDDPPAETSEMRKWDDYEERLTLTMNITLW